MLERLQTEIDAHPEFIGAERRIIMAELNKDGSAQTEAWQTIPESEEIKYISRGLLLTYLTPAQRKGLRDLMAGGTDDGEDVKMLYEADKIYRANNAAFIGLIDTLAVALSIDAGVAQAIKRHGERQISRAEELWQRKLVEGDFE